MDRCLRVGLYDECGVWEVFEHGWHALYGRFLGCGGGDYDGEDAEGGGCGERNRAGCRVGECYRPGYGVADESLGIENFGRPLFWEGVGDLRFWDEI